MKKINEFGIVRYYNENKQLHREDGPAVEFSKGDKYWLINGQHHRTDGPAIERSNGNKFWYKNDKLHREDGPAIEWSSGSQEWFINGEQLSALEFNQLRYQLNSDFSEGF